MKKLGTDYTTELVLFNNKVKVSAIRMYQSQEERKYKIYRIREENEREQKRNEIYKESFVKAIRNNRIYKSKMN